MPVGPPQCLVCPWWAVEGLSKSSFLLRLETMGHDDTNPRLNDTTTVLCRTTTMDVVCRWVLRRRLLSISFHRRLETKGKEHDDAHHARLNDTTTTTGDVVRDHEA